jgi:hypothetical protein
MYYRDFLQFFIMDTVQMANIINWILENTVFRIKQPVKNRYLTESDQNFFYWSSKIIVNWFPLV